MLLLKQLSFGLNPYQTTLTASAVMIYYMLFFIVCQCFFRKKSGNIIHLHILIFKLFQFFGDVDMFLSQLLIQRSDDLISFRVGGNKHHQMFKLTQGKSCVCFLQ